MFRQEIGSIGLSIEQETDSVPSDGKYHIILNGTVVSSFRSKSTALAKYRELRDRLLKESGFQALRADPRETLRREREHFDLQGIKSESRMQKEQKAKRKGGKAAGGGVR